MTRANRWARSLALLCPEMKARRDRFRAEQAGDKLGKVAGRTLLEGDCVANGK